MNSVFSVSVKYLKLVEGGEGYKKMNEVFLVNAVSYTDVEAKITEEMQMRTTSEFHITNINREKYAYVLTNDEDGVIRHFDSNQITITSNYTLDFNKSNK